MRSRGSWVRRGLAGASVLAAVLPWAVSAQEAEAGAERSAGVTLAEAVRAALVSHPLLEAARGRLDASEAALGAARAARLPTVATQGLATRYEEPMVVAPLHGFDLTSPPRFDRTLVQAHATAEWLAFDGGARRARIEAARWGAEAAEAGLAGTAEAVMADAVAAYLAASTAEALLAAHGERVAALVTERERASLLLEQGKTPRVALLRSEAALSRARAELEAARAAHTLAVHRLARVTGLDRERLSGGLAGVAGDAAGAGAEPLADREALVAAAMAANQDLERARRSAAAAASMVAAARAAYLPRLGVAARYSAYGSGEAALEPEWNAGVQVSWAVFTGGARSRAVERAAAEARAARAEAAVVARQVEEAVDRGLAAYRTAVARVDALTAAVAQSEEVVRIEALALEAGAGVQTDYLQAEAELLEVRAALAEARSAVLDARVRLARATASLSVAWISELSREGDR